MFKTYVKYLLLLCLPYVFDIQAAERGKASYKGQLTYSGMSPMLREAQARPPFLYTYGFPLLTGATAGVMGSGFRLMGSDNWSPYVAGGSLLSLLLANKMWHTSLDYVHKKRINLPMILSTVGGSGLGFALAKIMQDRGFNPYLFAAGAGALCGVGAQKLFASQKNVVIEEIPNFSAHASPLSNLSHEMQSFITKMGEEQVGNDNQKKLIAWRRDALQEFGPQLDDRQKSMLERAYHKDQIERIFNKNYSTDEYELEPKSLTAWLMWADDYHKTVSEPGWLAMVKAELGQNEKKEWFDQAPDVLMFIQQLPDAKTLNEIISREQFSYDPAEFFNKVRESDEFRKWQSSRINKVTY